MKINNFLIAILILSSNFAYANPHFHDGPFYPHHDHFLDDRIIVEEPLIVEEPYHEHYHHEIRRLQNEIEDLRIERDLHPGPVRTAEINDAIHEREKRMRYLENHY